MRLIDIFEKWSKSYKKSVNCSNPKGFSQRAHCAGRKARQGGRKTKSSSVNESKQIDYALLDALKDFLPIAVKFLKIKQIPKIKLAKELHDTNVPTFGRFQNESKVITVVVANRNPVDILRTLAHEMAHYAQGERGELGADSWHTGSDQENQAHEHAGIIMRMFNKRYPEYLSATPVIFEDRAGDEHRKIQVRLSDAIDQMINRLETAKIYVMVPGGRRSDAQGAITEVMAMFADNFKRKLSREKYEDLIVPLDWCLDALAGATWDAAAVNQTIDISINLLDEMNDQIWREINQAKADDDDEGGISVGDLDK